MGQHYQNLCDGFALLYKYILKCFGSNKKDVIKQILNLHISLQNYSKKVSFPFNTNMELQFVVN